MNLVLIVLVLLLILLWLLHQTRQPIHILIVAASGGLGRCIVNEALDRGCKVSVLVRSLSALHDAIGDSVDRVTVFVGDGTDVGLLNNAAKDVDVIVSAGPPNPELARAVGEACVNSPTCKRVVWTAGGSNILEADGKTMHYKRFGEAGEGYFKAHAPCIKAVQDTGATYIIWCPGKMDAAGKKSSPPVDIYTHAVPPGVPMDFVSYEDAADVILRASSTSDYDYDHIAAVTA